MRPAMSVWPRSTIEVGKIKILLSSRTLEVHLSRRSRAFVPRGTFAENCPSFAKLPPSPEIVQERSTWSISRRLSRALPNSRCGKIASRPIQLFRLARESPPYSSAPKSVIAIRSRLQLFCKLALGFSEKLNGTRSRGSQPEGRRGQDYDCH